MDGEQTCKKCGQTRALDEFEVRHDLKQPARQRTCRPCRAARVRERRRERLAMPLDWPNTGGRMLKEYGATKVCTGPCGLELPIDDFPTFRDPLGRERRKPRCRACKTKEQNQRRWAAGRPRREARDSNAPRVCTACGQEQASTEFEVYARGDRTLSQRAKCRTCIAKQRRERRTSKPKPSGEPSVLCRTCGVGKTWRKGRECMSCANRARAKQTAARRPKRVYTCPKCGITVGARDSLCRECKLQRNDGRSRDLRLGLSPLARARVARGELYKLDGQCTMCKKAITHFTRCYSCSTGRPRTLVRPDEHKDEGAAA